MNEAFRRWRDANPTPASELEYVNPFTLLVAVVLSAQSTDKGVNKATGPLFKVADTPEKMLKLGEEGLISYIKTIGLYKNKAKHIMGLSQKLIDDFEYGWNDYEGIDVKGKIVVVMVNDPGFYDSHLFRGRNMTYYGRWLYKFEEAQRQGAAGCLVLHHTEAASYGWHVCVNGHLSDNLAIYDPDTRNANELAVRGWLHEDGCRKLFLAAGMDMDKALADAKKPGFKSFPLNVRGDVKMNVTYDIQKTRNVGGILRGSGHNGEAVVFCAHWDHLGIGKADERGDTIYNGAADNASGVAGALLVAKKFKEMPRPHRDLLFIFPSSEESGLFGSAYYCDHPAVPMAKTVACLNFESIGPAELTRDVVILGGGESDLDNYYVAAAAAQGRYIYFDDDNSDGWFYRSDHYNFVKKGVRAVVLENGLHPVDVSKPNKYPMPVWYHKPCDEYREDWDLSGTLSNVNLIFSVGLSLSNNSR